MILDRSVARLLIIFGIRESLLTTHLIFYLCHQFRKINALRYVRALCWTLWLLWRERTTAPPKFMCVRVYSLHYRPHCTQKQLFFFRGRDAILSGIHSKVWCWCKIFYWCGQTWLWSDSTVKLSPTPTHQSNTSLTTTVPSSGPESETFLSGLGTYRQVTFKVPKPVWFCHKYCQYTNAVHLSFSLYRRGRLGIVQILLCPIPICSDMQSCYGCQRLPQGIWFRPLPRREGATVGSC